MSAGGISDVEEFLLQRSCLLDTVTHGHALEKRQVHSTSRTFDSGTCFMTIQNLGICKVIISFIVQFTTSWLTTRISFLEKSNSFGS